MAAIPLGNAIITSKLGVAFFYLHIKCDGGLFETGVVQAQQHLLLQIILGPGRGPTMDGWDTRPPSRAWMVCVRRLRSGIGDTVGIVYTRETMLD